MRIAQWLLRRGPEHVGVIIGSDAAGKTTMLYRLKLGEIVTTIPTIGFNVETIVYRDGGEITLWDVGGCDKIRPLIRHYMHSSRFLIFVHDCADRDPGRVEFSLEYLRLGLGWMVEHGSRHMFILLNKQDLLPPEERDAIVKELRGVFEAEIAQNIDVNKHHVKIVDRPGLSTLSGDQLYEVMDEIRETLQQVDKPKQEDTKAEITKMEKGPSEEELLRQIEKANGEGVDADAFWGCFLKGDLASWDHYTHLRAGFFVMRDCFARGLGLLECADEFMGHLDRLKRGNPERFRNTAHKTMTIFWLHQIQVASVNYQASRGLAMFPPREAYPEILLSMPSLINSGLWRNYYYKDLLFTPEARENWHLPDLQPLPIVTKGQPRDEQPRTKQSANDPDRLPRFAFSVVQKTLTSKLRRGGVVKQALDALQSSTIRLRAADPSVPPYSETQAYFWIQIIHAYIRSLDTGHSSQPRFEGSSTALIFEAFKALFDITGDEWRQYYSRSVWEGIPARMAFVNPDKKALPNVFGMPSQARVELARSQMVNAISHRFTDTPGLPAREELDFTAAVLIDEVKLMREEELNVASHASLLHFLYRRLSGQTRPPGLRDDEKRSASVASATALEVSSRMGVTQSMFWVQQVQICMAGGRNDKTFEEFVMGNAHLACEELPLVYYSPQVWESSEARGVFVPPDREALSSVVRGG